MGSTKIPTREEVLNDLAAMFVNNSKTNTLADNEFTKTMFKDKTHTSDRQAERFLRNLQEQGIIVVRNAVHNGHACKAYSYKEKANGTKV